MLILIALKRRKTSKPEGRVFTVATCKGGPKTNRLFRFDTEYTWNLYSQNQILNKTSNTPPKGRNKMPGRVKHNFKGVNV